MEDIAQDRYVYTPHTPNASIVPSALIKKLADSGIKQSHLKHLPNEDLEITFSLADKARFFDLPYVHLPRRSWEQVAISDTQDSQAAHRNIRDRSK
eukprot:gene15886-7218_t